MKKQSKQLNMLFTLVLIVLAVVSAVSVSWSYFTATSEKSGQMQFYDLTVRFVYYQSLQGGAISATDGRQIQLFVANGETVERNKSFNLASTEDGDPINSLAIQSSEDSCSSYVRFWVDAYVLDGNGNPIRGTNYGSYFAFGYNSDVAVANAGSNRTYENVIYCYKNAISGANVRRIGAMMTLSQDAPLDLLGEKIQIFMTLEAVQSVHDAYLSEFNDEKGYYSAWV